MRLDYGEDSEIHKAIDDRFKQQLEKNFGYYEKFMRESLTNEGKHKLAESYYRDLWDIEPEDESVFIALVDCLILQHDAEAACQVVESAERQGNLSAKVPNASFI